MIKKIILSLK